MPSNWVYGTAALGSGDYSIIYSSPREKYTVYTDTIGYFTGFFDTTALNELAGERKNRLDATRNVDPHVGTPIFTGDVIRFGDIEKSGSWYSSAFVVCSYAGAFYAVLAAKFEDFQKQQQAGEISAKDARLYHMMPLQSIKENIVCDFVLCGNIYDDPELLN